MSRGTAVSAPKFNKKKQENIIRLNVYAIIYQSELIRSAFNMRLGANAES